MQLQDLGTKPFAILFALIAIAPIVAGVALQRQAGAGNQLAFWGVVAICVLLFGVLALSMRNRSATIQGAELKVRSTFYSITVSLASITDVRKVEPGSKDDLVGWRINGVGLPGFRSGWFNSRAGGRLFVDRVAGDYLLVSVDGKPRMALEFADNQAAASLIATRRL